MMKVFPGYRTMVTAFCLTFAGLFVANGDVGTQSNQVVYDFKGKLDFSYLAWKDKVNGSESFLALRDLKCNGGGGINKPFNLSAQGLKCPALKIRTKPGNTAKILKLIVSDNAGRSGHWEFPLPESSEQFAAVTPKGGASLAKPLVVEDKNTPENPGQLDLANIIQFQVLGDWSKDKLDVDVDALVLVEPTEKLLAQRKVAEKNAAEEAARKAKLAAEKKAKEEQERQEQIRKYSVRSEKSPEVVHVSLVAPDVLSLVIRAQKITLPKLSKYVPQEGDEVEKEKWSDGVVRRAKLKRNGKTIGWLQGRKLDTFTTFETMEGDPLLAFLAEKADNFTVTSGDDADFQTPVKPQAAYRKSKPVNWKLSGGWAYPMQHTVYLKMPAPLKADKTYTINIDQLNVKNPNLTFKADLKKVLSESVHVNQIGYHPADTPKCAFLSVWLGTGGSYDFKDGLSFQVLDDETGKTVQTGKVKCILPSDGKEALGAKEKKNFSKTAVYRLDFSDLKQPGKYRVFVEGVGCSYPFVIDEKVWEHAFKIQMKGLYNNRSGTELGPPYSDFKKPRDFYPGDGAVVTRSNYDPLTQGDHAYDNIAKGDTGERVDNAWGGYHDAGDWNPRRVSHMKVTMAHLELAELYPEYFNKLDLNIPNKEGIPDIITEALFEIDCFRRLQDADGGIPFGIETKGDPSPGEISWLSTQHEYVVKPNFRDSWFYAAVAARAAKVLKPINSELSKVYEESAIRAFNWAEKDYARRKAEGGLEKLKEAWVGTDAQNLAALILYDLTGEQKWHDVFLKTTCLYAPEGVCWWGKHIQCDAAFLYARMDDSKTDAKMKQNARKAVLMQAQKSLDYAAGNSFNLTTMDKYRPLFGGFFSTSGGTELARAHYLTGDDKYLKGVVASCQFQSGCNPNNIVYTTGLGANPVKHPLHLDSRSTGQAPPIGFTVFGNVNYWRWKGGFWDWPIKFIGKPEVCYPHPYDWPLTEAYFDIYLFVSMNEFVVDTWAPNVFVWGYLASLPSAMGASAVINTDAESNLLLLKNDKLVLGVLPEVGGRIVLLRTPDGKNVIHSAPKMWNQKSPKVSSAEPEFVPYNGHIYWLGPQDDWWGQQDVNPEKKEKKASWPPDPFTALGNYTVAEQTATSVKLVGPKSPVSGLQLTKEFSLQGNKVLLKATATNIRNSAVSWDIWSNTRLPEQADVYVPASPKGGSIWMEFKAWQPLKMVPLSYRVTNGFYNYDLDTINKDMDHLYWSKLFIYPGNDYVAAFVNDCLFIKRAERVPKKEVHPKHAFVEVYKHLHEKGVSVTELEMHSPYKTLKPGESMSFAEEWELVPVKGINGTQARTEYLTKHYGAAKSDQE